MTDQTNAPVSSADDPQDNAAEAAGSSAEVPTAGEAREGLPPDPSAANPLPPPAVTGPEPPPPNPPGLLGSALTEEEMDDEPEADPPDEPDDPEDNPQDVQETSPNNEVTVTVTKFPLTSGVTLLINGKEFRFPLGKPVTVPRWVLPSLAAVGGIEFTKESP